MAFPSFAYLAGLYVVATLARFLTQDKYRHRWEKICSVAEQICFLLLTVGIIFYISRLQLNNGHVQSKNYIYPVSWLLFAWCLNAANFISAVMYRNHFTGSFITLWTALSLALLPRIPTEGFSLFFSYDLQWLNVPRLCFLLGYAFCLLVFPLMLRYFWESIRLIGASPKSSLKILSPMDRMSYRMILWALPLLTLGVLLEAMQLIDAHELPRIEQLWGDRKETLLAIATWFICGVYLHSRIFFGWKDRRAALLYLGSFLIILAGHLSAIFL